MNEQKILRRMAELGIADFETLADVERQQKKFIRNLRASSITPSQCAGFEGCNETICGRRKCSEVCRFAAYDRRVKHIAAAHKLITQCGEPIFEMRIARGCWVRHIGDLGEVSIGAAKQLNRRSLDSLHNSNLVAVGAFKVGPGNLYVEDLWVAEIHQLVAGGDMAIENIKAAFSAMNFPPMGISDYPDVIWTKKVENVGQVLSNIFDYRLRPYKDPRETGVYWPAKLTMALWDEYYRWRLPLPANLCLIRYGCDRYFNKLDKEPRKIRVPKKRKYPEWLIPYMFGNEPKN